MLRSAPVKVLITLFMGAILILSGFSAFDAQAEETLIQTTSVDTTISSSTTHTSASTTTQVKPYFRETVPGGDYVAGDFVVGPGKADLTIAKGSEKTIEMSVTNRTGETRKFTLSVEDAEGSTDPTQGVVLLGDDRGPYSLKDFVSFPTQTFELKHNERVRIPITVRIPKDAESGGRYGSVLVETVAREAETGTSPDTVPQSAIVARIGTLFFVTIPGGVEKGGSLSSFTTVPPKKWYQHGPINFGLLFENTGSIHLAPYGEVRITNMLGEEVGQVALEPWFVLPQSTRLREVTWNREFLFGRYVAHATINRSYDNQIDEKEYVFWVLPWTLVLLGFGIVFIIVFLIRAFFRTFEFKRKR